MRTSISAITQSLLSLSWGRNSRWIEFVVFLLLCTLATTAEAGQVNTSLTQSIMNPGETTTLKIDLKNPLQSPLTNLRFSTPLVLPAGMTVTNAASFVTTSCGGNITLNLATDRKSFNISGGTIPAAPNSYTEGKCTISIDVTTTVQGNSTISLPVGSVLNDQNETNINPAQITLQVNNVSAPTISLGFNPNTVSSGQISTLTIGIKNNDTKLSMTGVNLLDSLPLNLSIAGAAGTSNCGSGTISTSTNSSGVNNTYALTNATVATGATCTITFPVVSNTAGTYNYSILNTSNKFTNNQGLISTSSPSATLSVQDLLVFTSFNPTTTAVNQSAQLIIDLENWGTVNNYTGVTLTDILPANLIIAPTPNITNSCGGTATATTNSSTNIATIQLGNRTTVNGVTTVTNGGTIDKGDGVNPGKCRITVDVISTVAATYTNTIAANAVITNQGAKNPYAVAATLKVIVLGGNGSITVDKAFSPTLIAVNSRSQLKITITNSNTNLSKNLTNLRLVDNFANPLLKIASPANASTTCTGATIAAVPGTSSLTIDGGQLLKNNSCTITIDVTSGTPTTSAAPYNNTIDLGSITTAEGETNSNSKTASLNVSPGVEVSQTFTPTTIAANGHSILVVTLKNYLPYAVTGVSLTDPLPQNSGKAILVDPTDNKATTCMGGVVTVPSNRQSFSISGATIPAGVGNTPGICTFQVDVTSSANTNTSNTTIIPVGSIVANQQGISNTNSASAKLTFRNDLDIEVNKSFDPISVSPGGYSTAMITVGNQTTADYPNLEFTDNLPLGMRVANVPNPTTTCLGGTITAIPGATSFNFKGQKMASLTSCNIKVRVTSTSLTNLINTIGVGTISSTNGVKNSQSASATLDNNTSLGVAKSFSPAIVAPNQVSQMRIEIYNPYIQPLSGLAWTDSLISGLQVDTATATTNSCGGSLNISTNPITLTGANIGAQASCAVTLGVKSATVGSYLNKIPANRPDLSPPTVGVTTIEGFSNYYEAKDTLIVANQPTVTKSFTPTSIAPYGVSTLKLTLTNPNDSDSYLTQDFVDNLPAGMTVASSPNIKLTGASDCTITKPNVIATAGDNKVTILNGALLPKKTTTTINGGCTIAIDVNATTVGTYTNRVLGGTLQTTMGKYLTDATADLMVVGNGNFRIVKRITGINGTTIGIGANGTSIDLTSPSNDTDLRWPNSYIRGAKDGGFVRSGDTIEYTVYFLSNGNYPVTDVSVCDRIPANTTFLPNSFGTDRGMILQLGNGNFTSLTNSGTDSDRGQLIPANNVRDSCRKLPGGDGIQVELANRNWSSDKQLPANFYGLVRFQVKVD
jgi:uncharacterized repeat protein (TIGR01451 family)